MWTAKKWMTAAFVAIALAGSALVIESACVRMVSAQGVVMEDHWRYHDGHWSTYNAADKRWYYTNGNHWYFNDGRAWRPYAFDGHFGRKGFEHGGYKVPGPNVKVIIPEHRVYVP
ncbi:MAG: hypothetical protein JWM11_6703 [Planctomycetaceae bacterium]|nr:hypothetical protein [Planctomycetaceae bacterium]